MTRRTKWMNNFSDAFPSHWHRRLFLFPRLLRVASHLNFHLATSRKARANCINYRTTSGTDWNRREKSAQSICARGNEQFRTMSDILVAIMRVRAWECARQNLLHCVAVIGRVRETLVGYSQSAVHVFGEEKHFGEPRPICQFALRAYRFRLSARWIPDALKVYSPTQILAATFARNCRAS